MRACIEIFWGQEDGAAVVDWVVLSAAIVGLGIVVIATIGGGTLDHTSNLNDYLVNTEVKETF